MKTRRILLVSPYPPKRDGLANYSGDLAASLALRSEVAVLTQRRRSCRRETGSIPVIPALSAGPVTIVRFLRVARQFCPNVVHIQFTLPAYGIQALWLLLAVAWLHRRGGVSIVWTLHEVVREVELLRGIGRLLYRAIGRISDALVVLSAASADCLAHSCSVGADIAITPHGVPRRSVVRPPQDRSVGPIVYFGYLHPDKGIEHLLAAITMLRKSRTTPELIIAGAVRPRDGLFRIFERRDREYVERLRALADDNVRFLGYLEDDQLDDLLTGAIAVVFPYTAVTQSGAINRAVALGCPVVASDLPGLRDDIPHEAGVVAAARPEELADALEKLISNPTLQQQMAAASVEIAYDRSSERQAEKLSEVYDMASARHHS